MLSSCLGSVRNVLSRLSPAPHTLSIFSLPLRHSSDIDARESLNASSDRVWDLVSTNPSDRTKLRNSNHCWRPGCRTQAAARPPRIVGPESTEGFVKAPLTKAGGIGILVNQGDPPSREDTRK